MLTGSTAHCCAKITLPTCRRVIRSTFVRKRETSTPQHLRDFTPSRFTTIKDFLDRHGDPTLLILKIHLLFPVIKLSSVSCNHMKTNIIKKSLRPLNLFPSQPSSNFPNLPFFPKNHLSRFNTDFNSFIKLCLYFLL